MADLVDRVEQGILEVAVHDGGNGRGPRSENQAEALVELSRS